MDANSLLAVVFIGLFVLSCAALVIFYMVVVRLTNAGVIAENPIPTKKTFVRPASAKATPELVGAPKEITPVVPQGGMDGVTHIDTTKSEDYLELHQVTKNDLGEAVDKYLRGEGSGTEAISSVVESEA